MIDNNVIKNDKIINKNLIIDDIHELVTTSLFIISVCF
jgi:hypothetical protein